MHQGSSTAACASHEGNRLLGVARRASGARHPAWDAGAPAVSKPNFYKIYAESKSLPMAIVESSALFNTNVSVSVTQAAIKLKWLEQVSAPAKLLPVRQWQSPPHSTAQRLAASLCLSGCLPVMCCLAAWRYACHAVNTVQHKTLWPVPVMQ